MKICLFADTAYQTTKQFQEVGSRLKLTSNAHKTFKYKKTATHIARSAAQTTVGLVPHRRQILPSSLRLDDLLLLDHKYE
jgi:hypothetical protein